LRRQLRILSQFITGFDFVRMTPDDSVVVGGAPAGGSVRALVDRERTMAIYARRAHGPRAVPSSGPTSLQLAIPDGTWHAEWVETTSGTVLARERVIGGGTRTLVSPDYVDDIALRLVRQGGA
jgi:hypothetical protein